MTNIEELTEVVNQQIELLEKLNTALNEEHSVLEARQYENLEPVLHHKVTLLEQLRLLEIKQLELTQSLINSDINTPISLKMLIKQLGLDAPSPLSSLEEQLTLLANKCNDQNKINGMMIHSRRRINQRFIQLLQNQMEPATAATYGRNGETNNSSIAATSVQA